MSTTKGWNFITFHGQTASEEMPVCQVKTSQSQLDIQGALVNYKEKGCDAKLFGIETIEGSKAYKIKLSNMEGKFPLILSILKTFTGLKVSQKERHRKVKWTWKPVIQTLKTGGGIYFSDFQN